MEDPPFDLGHGPDDFPAPFGDEALIEAIGDHCERFFGECEFVWHEVVSEFVHIDLHVFRPDPISGIRTIVTSGMAEKPMHVPKTLVDPEKYRYAELVLQIPPNWPVDQNAFADPECSWPFWALKSFARLPHQYETWVWSGHTMASDPPEPYSEHSKLCAATLWPSLLLPEEFEGLTLPDGREVVFLTLGFLYAEELAFSKRHSQERLLAQIERRKLPLEQFLILNPDRPSACGETGFWPFRKH